MLDEEMSRVVDSSMNLLSPLQFTPTPREFLLERFESI